MTSYLHILALVASVLFLKANAKSHQITPVANGEPYKIAVIGDWGLEGNEMQKTVAGAMADWVEENDAQFILSMGDNFYDNGVASVDDPLFDTAWRQVYLTLPALENKVWYVAPGNKEHDGNAQAQVEFSQIEPLWYMPNLYFSFTKTIGNQTARFIIIDSKTMDEQPEQITWFIEEIIKSQEADWLFVVSHHPLYSAGKNGPRNRTKWLRKVVLPYIEKYRAALFLFGHDHNLQHTYKEGEFVDHVCSGGGHDFNDLDQEAYEELQEIGVTSKYFGKGHGFVGLSIQGDIVTVTYIRENGDVEYEFTKKNPRA